MCRIIVVNKGEKEVATPNEFNQVFGCFPTLYDDVPESIDITSNDCCLCDFDIEASLYGLRIPYGREFDGKHGDFYVELNLDDND